MEISEIKQRLSLATVLQHYGLKPDKSQRLHCPFHDDRTPSMQIYYKTHTAYCFSSNCKTHGRSLDVIDFIMYKENCSKHEALKKAAAFLEKGEGSREKGIPSPCSLLRSPFLTNMFQYFKNAVHNSKPAQAYLESRCLDYRKLEVGFNGGQFHHGQRKDETLINQCLEYGLLIDSNLTGRTGEKAYHVFGKNCIVFPLKNRENEIVGLYFRSTLNDKEQRHFYLRNRTGLYPGYPKTDTKTLILTESIIDAATLSIKNYELRIKRSEESILALYGTNGLTEEHIKAIRSLPELEEVILFLNGDAAGRSATDKYAKLLKTTCPKLVITSVDVPEGEDVNSLIQGHEAEILAHLIEKRKEFLFSTEEEVTSNELQVTSYEKKSTGEKSHSSPVTCHETPPSALQTDDPYNLYYRGEAADWYVKGGIRCPMDSLKISLQIIERSSRMDVRSKVDLYEHRQITQLQKLVYEKLGIDKCALSHDISSLTKELEIYRKARQEAGSEKAQKKQVTVPAGLMNRCLDFLKSGNLLEQVNELLGRCGIVGEETNRLFLFLTGCSYKMPDTLHALIQGSSGSGKTRLLKIICDVMPPEDVIKFTRVTDNSFYNYREDYLANKLLGFEDIDGLKEEAMYAVRELISNEILISSTTTKTEEGQLMAVERTVRGPVASISCTTKGEVYEDNMSRVFLISVDESAEQTRRIIHYQQQTACGQIEYAKEREQRYFLQNCVRLLKPYEVINPYANRIRLPEQAHKIRRLNDLYLSFVKQITLLHQYQREKDSQGRLLSSREDLRLANEIMFESIVLKVDELDGSLRQFFERLKSHILKLGKEEWFILRDIRHSLNLSKTQLHRYVNELVELEYLQQKGYANKGYQYQIVYWDNIEVVRAKIKQELDIQIQTLKNKS